MVDQLRTLLAKALALLVVAMFLLACGPTPPAQKTVPVTVRAVETIEPEHPTGNTVILLGKVIDSRTSEEIPTAQVVIESSDRGTMRFSSPFVFSFPTMSIITLATTAPGYEPRQEVMKPHYRCNVTLTLSA